MNDNCMLNSNTQMPVLDDEVLEEAAACLKIMAHPVRLKIADILTREEPSVGELAAMIGLPHHQVCEHLRLMQNCGFLVSERAGRTVHYKIASPKLPNLVECIRKNCNH